MLTSLASQRPKKGRVWWTTYTSRVPPHSTVQFNHVEFFHMMHYITVWVAITALKTAKESYDIISITTEAIKTLWLYFMEHAYSTTGNSRVYSLKSGYIIQLFVFWWDMTCICSSPDPSLLCGSGSGLHDYMLTHTKCQILGAGQRKLTLVDLLWQTGVPCLGTLVKHNRRAGKPA